MFIKARALRALAVGCALLAPMVPAAALAQDVNIVVGDAAAPTGRQADDQKVVNAALAAMNAHGFPGLEAHIPALKGVLAHAPESFPMVERTGDQIIIRADDDGQYFLLSLVAAAPAAEAGGGSKDGKPSVQVRRGENTYPIAALALGSFYVEFKQPDEALIYLERGLKIQPNNPSLITEKGAALLLLRRFADVVALYDAALASDDLALVADKAKFMRNRGVALIDLGRLDEAEKALKDSIKADPKDKLGVDAAKHELRYIKGLRAGAEPTNIELKTRQQAEEAAAQPKQ